MSITESATAFFDSIERGEGWENCRRWCHADASFSCQAKALADLSTLAEYADWMKDLFDRVPDGTYDLKGLATDHDRDMVLGYAVFRGTSTGANGEQVAFATDYVYAMSFDGRKIRHLTKIWNDTFV